MGIKANYKIKSSTKNEFLNNIRGVGTKDEFIKADTKGGVAEIIYMFGNEFAGDLARKLNELNDVDTGKLIDSFDFKIKKLGTNYKFTFSLNDYYEVLDKGRRPGGKFPWDSSKGLEPDGKGNVLYQWVKRNNYIMFNKNTTTSVKTKKLKIKGGKKSNQLTLAYLIGRKIQKHGTKGNKFFSSTTNDGRIAQLTKDLSVALKTDVIVDIKEFVKTINTR